MRGRHGHRDIVRLSVSHSARPSSPLVYRSTWLGVASIHDRPDRPLMRFVACTFSSQSSQSASESECVCRSSQQEYADEY